MEGWLLKKADGEPQRPGFEVNRGLDVQESRWGTRKDRALRSGVNRGLDV